MKDLIDKVEKASNELDILFDELRSNLIGKKVKIISSYNGQPYGSSKKPLTGKIFEIRSVYRSTSSYDKSCIGIFIENQLLGLSLDEVEILDDE